MPNETPTDGLSCVAITKAGHRCKLRPRPGTDTCSRHAPSVDDSATPIAAAPAGRLSDDEVLYAAHVARTEHAAGLTRPARPGTPVAPSTRAGAGGGVGFVVLALVLAVLWAIGNAGSDGVDVPAAYGGGEAWTKAYSSTTCGDWRAVMTPGQRRTYVSDNLVGLRERNGGATPLPSPAQVEGMLSEVSVGCGAGLAPRESIVIAYFAGEDIYGT